MEGFDKIVGAMKNGQPYISYGERFYFEVIKVEIKSQYKISYRLIKAGEAELTDDVARDLGEDLSSVPGMVSYGVTRGLTKNAEWFISFELVVRRSDKEAGKVPEEQEEMLFKNKENVELGED